jgi:hypothetical protein
VARAFDVTPEQALALTSKLLDRDSIVRVLADPTAGTEHVRTGSGQMVPATTGDRRYTTTELLAAEQRIIGSGTARIGEGTARVPLGTVDHVLARHPHLDGEQADGVRALLTSGNGYDLVIGQAGTGKSSLLGAARSGWKESGFTVIGTAVAARTAADLEAGTGIPSSSLTQLLADLREGGGLTSRHVIVVDEASLVGSRPLDRLRSHVDGAGAKLVLTGDNRQLSSIDAGGALRSLSQELGDHVVHLTTNRRQAGSDQQWERDALVALRDGNAERAVHAYTEHGRVTISGTIDEARHRLVEDWWAVHRDHTTAILAVRRADVVALNDMVRARRLAGGELGSEIKFGTRAYMVGDRVLFEKNQRVAEAGNRAGRPVRLQVQNGTFGTVVGAIDPAADAPTREGDVPRARGDTAGPGETMVQAEAATSLVVELDDGRRAVLPRSYVESSTSLGYALTVFRSQGITVDHTFGLGGDSLFQEAGYTQLSRGRLSNNLYVAAPENPRWEIGHHADDTAQRDALQSLVGALGQSREQTMAQDNVPQWPASSRDDLSAIYHRHATVARWLADQAPPDVTDALAAASDRAHSARVSGRETRSAEADVSALVARQRSRDDGWRRTETRSRRGLDWRATSGATSTASIRPPAIPSPSMSRLCSARSPNASVPSNDGRARREPSRRIAPDGTSTAQPPSGPNRPIPNNVPTGTQPLPLLAQPDSSTLVTRVKADPNGHRWPRGGRTFIPRTGSQKTAASLNRRSRHGHLSGPTSPISTMAWTTALACKDK